jgi:hypothetical protein
MLILDQRVVELVHAPECRRTRERGFYRSGPPATTASKKGVAQPCPAEATHSSYPHA